MTNRTLPTLIVMVSLLVLMAGCGDDDDAASSGAQEDAATAAPAEGPKPPYGTYARPVTKRDIARTAAIRNEYGPNQETPPSGTYRLVIAKGAGQDVLKASDPSGFTIAQDITVDGGQIRLTSYVDPSVGAFCGPEIPAQAQYAFAVDGSSLGLSPDPDDPCADRDSILTGTWRQG
jgi:hypothetical protein